MKEFGAEGEVDMVAEKKRGEKTPRPSTSKGDGGPPAKRPSPNPTQRRLLQLAGALTGPQQEQRPRAASPPLMELDVLKEADKSEEKKAPVPLLSLQVPEPALGGGRGEGELGPAGQRLLQQGRLGAAPNAALTHRPCYTKEDVRSRLFPQYAEDAPPVVSVQIWEETIEEEDEKEEKEERAPTPGQAIAEQDSNLRVAAQSREVAKIPDLKKQFPNIRFVPLPAEIDNAPPDPIVKSKIANDKLGKEGKARNPYALVPTFHARCSFCSSRHCSRFVAGTNNPNCHKYREQLMFAPNRRLCEYRRCYDTAAHHTAVCPLLHRRCDKCGCRGHDASSNCDVRNPSIMHRLRADFEEAANYGLYTKYRFEAVEWGFYPIPQVRPPGNFVSYSYLTSLPVVDAMAMLQAALLLPENAAQARDHAPCAQPQRPGPSFTTPTAPSTAPPTGSPPTTSTPPTGSWRQRFRLLPSWPVQHKPLAGQTRRRTERWRNTTRRNPTTLPRSLPPSWPVQRKPLAGRTRRRMETTTRTRPATLPKKTLKNIFL